VRRLNRHMEIVHIVSRYDQIYHLVSPIYPNEENTPGYWNLYIFYSAEATTKALENQSNQGYVVEVMQRLDKMLQQSNQFAESYKRMDRKKLNFNK
jgi:hypothetical protein